MAAQFDLTSTLMGDIVDALETQGQHFAVDGTGGLVAIGDGECAIECATLPKWGNAEGYAMREEFVKCLHAPFAREALQEALHTGRGAFRAFKDALASYPQVERLWHRYKRQQMESYVWAWYDSLCDEWGLEHLERLDDEDASTRDDLLCEDFVFSTFDTPRDGKEAAAAMAKGLSQSTPSNVAAAMASRWLKQCMTENAADAGGEMCRTLDGTFAGCVTTVRDGEHGVVFVTGIFVTEEWRGLGIARALMEKVLSLGGGYFVASLPVTSGALEGLFKQACFEKGAAGYMAAA